MDLVPQSCRELELELASRGMHLIGELLDQVGEVSRGHPGEILGVPADITGCPRRQPGDRRFAARLLPATPADEHLSVSVLARDRVEDVGDLLAEWLRVEATLRKPRTS